MKHIGILAHSAEGSALCYLETCHQGIKQLGSHLHPTITMDVIAMGATLNAYEKDNFESVKTVLLQSVKRLELAGCDFFICPDNTAHLPLESSGDPFPLPALHIAGVVANHTNKKGFQKVGILGTKWTMSGPIYRKAFEKNGVTWAVPNDDDIALINRFIFDELCNGIFKDRTIKEFVRVIDDLKKDGCDAVVLGCTEIPLIITPEISPLPTLDSTRLLAKAAVEVALGNQPMPTWAGGPVYSKA